MTKADLLEDFYDGDAGLAEALDDISPHTARDWRYAGDGPPYVKIGRRIYYPKDAAREWLRKRVVGAKP